MKGLVHPIILLTDDTQVLIAKNLPPSLTLTLIILPIISAMVSGDSIKYPVLLGGLNSELISVILKNVEREQLWH